MSESIRMKELSWNTRGILMSQKFGLFTPDSQVKIATLKHIRLHLDILADLRFNEYKALNKAAAEIENLLLSKEKP